MSAETTVGSLRQFPTPPSAAGGRLSVPSAFAGDALLPMYSGVLSAAESTVLKAAKTDISAFAEHSQVLMKALKEVAKIHPFIAVAVVAFEAAVKLVITFNENNNRITALYVQMNDMMETLLLVRNLNHSEADEHGVETRLMNRVDVISSDIEKCANACDSYKKSHLAVRIINGPIWERRLSRFAVAFNEHQRGIYEDVHLYVARGVADIKDVLTYIKTTVADIKDNLLQEHLTKAIAAHPIRKETDMLLVFEHLRTPRERELMDFIERKGGEQAVLSSDILMRELAEEAQATSDDGAALDDPDVREEQIAEVIRGAHKDVDATLLEDKESFEKKFALQKKFLIDALHEEYQWMVEHLRDGPQNRIIDPDLRSVWENMGWKNSVKARHLVMALREHYAEVFHDAASSHHASEDSTSDPGSGPDGCGTEVPIHDAWALEYISMIGIQPLMEAFDDDASTFVTVVEVNRFTSARPAEWSLPKWIAYWTTGFEMTLSHYYNLIHNVLAVIETTANDVLPSNRYLVGQFVSNSAIHQLEALLAGIHDGNADRSGDQTVLPMFIDYVNTEEERLRQNLDLVGYCIDAPNTLSLVIGAGRLDKDIMPLVYLLLCQTLRIVARGCSHSLHERELLSISRSMQTMWSVIQRDRLPKLKALYRTKDLDYKTQMRKFSFGMYYYFDDFQALDQSTYFMRIPWEDYLPDDDESEDQTHLSIVPYSCPDEEEMNKNRALWLFAIRSVLRCLRWKESFSFASLEHKRVIRNRYIELCNRAEDNDLTKAEHMELSDLERAIHRQDLLFYQSLSEFYRKRVVRHFAVCDFCKRSPRMTRLTCLVCSAGKPYSTLDLCIPHREAELHRAEDDLHHIPTHPFLQLRHCVSMGRGYKICSWARREEVRGSEILADAELGSNEPCKISACHRCARPAVRPFWYCIVCADNVFLCPACNLQDEERRPWCSETKVSAQHTGEPAWIRWLQWRRKLEKKHHWSHPLVLCQPPVTAARTTTLGEQLAQQEDMLRVSQHRLALLEKEVVTSREITRSKLDEMSVRLTAIVGLFVAFAMMGGSVLLWSHLGRAV